jgi:predicted  nucleic acid-binding Zn-ribbon protein
MDEREKTETEIELQEELESLAQKFNDGINTLRQMEAQTEALKEELLKVQGAIEYIQAKLNPEKESEVDDTNNS